MKRILCLLCLFASLNISAQPRFQLFDEPEAPLTGEEQALVDARTKDLILFEDFNDREVERLQRVNRDRIEDGVLQIDHDGQHLYFLSTRPREGVEYQPGWSNQDIWAVDRTEDGWSKPYNLGLPIDTDQPEFFPSVTRDGTMYFTRGGRESYIFRSRLVDGAYTTPERLPQQVNSTQNQYNAFIAPDESYLIFATPARPDGLGRDDYFVCFRGTDDTWSEPVNLGEPINSPRGYEYSPYVSPDGKYFFFSAQRTKTPEEYYGEEVTYDEIMTAYNEPENGNIDIYWVSAAFIEQLRPAE